MSEDFDIPTNRWAGLTREEAKAIAVKFSAAGIKADEAAENIREFGRGLANLSTAAATLKTVNYEPIEQRMIAMMQQEVEAGLLNPECLYGVGEWREISKQRARKLRHRGEHVERNRHGYRWWRPCRRK